MTGDVDVVVHDAPDEHGTRLSPSCRSSHGDSHCVEMAAVGEGGAESVVRIRSPEDMAHLISSVRLRYTADFKASVKQWESEPELNTTECRYLGSVRAQGTPLGANRHILLFFFLAVVFLRGCTYWGWNGLQDMLYKSGAFAWKCDVVTGFQRIGDTDYVDCPQRKNAINDLYTAALACNFIFSAVGGMILDHVGPKLTLVGSVLVDGLGWSLLAGASESFQAYVPAMVFIGMAADPGYLALICLSNLYPSYESTVMGVMGSVRSLSFAIPVILAEIFKSNSLAPDSLWKVLIGYIVIGLGTSLAIAAFFVPMSPFKGAEDFRREDREAQIRSVRGRVLGSVSIGFFRQWETATPPQEPAKRYKLLLTPQEYQEVVKVFDEVGEEETKHGQELSRSAALKDPRFLLLLPVFVVNLLRAEFYTKSNKEQMLLTDGRNLYIMFSVCNILSFIPGPLMGYGIDRLGILTVLGFLNCAGIGMYALVMPDILACKVLSLICFWLYASFVLSSIYCYIKINFPNKLFGTLAGIVSLVGGVFALTSVGWYKLSSETLLSWYPRNFWLVDGLMIAGGFIVLFVIVVMHVFDKKVEKKRLAEEKRKHEAVTTSGHEIHAPSGGLDNPDSVVCGCIEVES